MSDKSELEPEDRALAAQIHSNVLAAKNLRWVIIINLPLSLATLVLAVYTYSIAASTSHLRENSDTANEITKDNFKKQFRAYIVPTTDMRITRTAQGLSLNNFMFEAGFKNVGQSPATNVTVETAITIFPNLGRSDLSLNFGYKDDYCAQMQVRSRSVIGSGEQVFYNIPRKQFTIDKSASKELVKDAPVEDFDQNLESSFEEGLAVALIHGAICYDDVFGQRHYARLCRYFLNKNDLSQLSATECKSGNEID